MSRVIMTKQWDQCIYHEFTMAVVASGRVKHFDSFVNIGNYLTRSRVAAVALKLAAGASWWTGACEVWLAVNVVASEYAQTRRSDGACVAGNDRARCNGEGGSRERSHSLSRWGAPGSAAAAPARSSPSAGRGHVYSPKEVISDYLSNTVI